MIPGLVFLCALLFVVGVIWAEQVLRLQQHARMRTFGAIVSGDPRGRFSIGAAVQTKLAEVQCPNCHSRHLRIEGTKATCCGCSNVWDWRNPPLVFKGGA